MSITPTCLGYPRIGIGRELKKAQERLWSKDGSEEELQNVASTLREKNWKLMKSEGFTTVPCNDFSLYDHMLDMAVTVNAIPPRYQQVKDPLARYFAMARGLQDPSQGVDLPALEMTKWFDTNYHYIVPEIQPQQSFTLNIKTILSAVDQARSLGLEPRPVIVGPVSFLLLSKMSPDAPSSSSTLEALDRLLPVYHDLLAVLAEKRVTWVQIDEPCLVLDLSETAKEAFKKTFLKWKEWQSRPKILLTTYFGALGENLQLAIESNCEGIHIDVVRAPEQFDKVLSQVQQKDKLVLSLGVVDGRNIWRTDLDAAHAVVRKAVKAIGADRVLVSSSCSLLHVPVDLQAEKKLDSELVSWLAFASQKVREISLIASEADKDVPNEKFEESRQALANRRNSSRINNPAVRSAVDSVVPKMLERQNPFSVRSAKQKEEFKLPSFPTTTIGSFPQTKEVRSARASWRTGKLSNEDYDKFLEEETVRCIRKQESIGLDVLVHGEFERTDMVEYFGQKMGGFAFTQNGWVQSYGSRCVKPPVLFGDVSRPQEMTVKWSKFAQSKTSRPMKGMLTGPVTILQWSFVRDDQPRSETCKQIALALRDEVVDLEKAGIRMVQVDEPAIREGLPLRKGDWEKYLKWAVDSFRLATSGVTDSTQIHTHMCYSEFGDILPSVAAMDADVLSIETSRSKMGLLVDFGKFKYPNDIGPGVFDIHSPRVPPLEEIVDLLTKAVKVVPSKQLWVNPDCGLKTRGWTEVEKALTEMVEGAKIARKTL